MSHECAPKIIDSTLNTDECDSHCNRNFSHKQTKCN